jgi:hypothetical protein
MLRLLHGAKRVVPDRPPRLVLPAVHQLMREDGDILFLPGGHEHVPPERDRAAT